MNRLLTSAICLLLSLVLGIVFIYPQYQELQIIKEEIEEKKAELQTRQQYFSDLRDISETLKKYETQLTIIDSALPPRPSLPNLFNVLQKIASQNGLILEKITQQIIDSPGEPKEIKITLSLSGSYSSLKSFISALEKSARIFESESISFSASKEEGEEVKPFTFNLQIKTHSY